MDTQKIISAVLAVALVVVFVLVSFQVLSWVTFWIMSAALLIYVTYVLPSDDQINGT